MRHTHVIRLNTRKRTKNILSHLHMQTYAIARRPRRVAPRHRPSISFDEQALYIYYARYIDRQ